LATNNNNEWRRQLITMTNNDNQRIQWSTRCLLHSLVVVVVVCQCSYHGLWRRSLSSFLIIVSSSSLCVLRPHCPLSLSSSYLVVAAILFLIVVF
jgi:hypothetical protein